MLLNCLFYLYIHQIFSIASSFFMHLPIILYPVIFFISSPDGRPGFLYFSIGMKLNSILKNLYFLLLHVPFAAGRAEKHFRIAIEYGEKFGAPNIAGTAYMDLGLLHLAKKREAEAVRCLEQAKSFLEPCGGDFYVAQIQQLLDRINRVPEQLN